MLGPRGSLLLLGTMFDCSFYLAGLLMVIVVMGSAPCTNKCAQALMEFIFSVLLASLCAVDIYSDLME